MKSTLIPIGLGVSLAFHFFINIFVADSVSQRQQAELVINEAPVALESDDNLALLKKVASLFGVEYQPLQNDAQEVVQPSIMLDNISVTIRVIRSIDDKIEALVEARSDNLKEESIIASGDDFYGFQVVSVTPRRIVFNKNGSERTVTVFEPDQLNEKKNNE